MKVNEVLRWQVPLWVVRIAEAHATGMGRLIVTERFKGESYDAIARRTGRSVQEVSDIARKIRRAAYKYIRREVSERDAGRRKRQRRGL